MTKYLTFIGCFVAGMICLYVIQRTRDYFLDRVAWAILIGVVMFGGLTLFAKPKKLNASFLDEEEAAYRSAKHDLILELNQYQDPFNTKLVYKNRVRTVADMLDHLHKDTFEARDFVEEYLKNRKAKEDQELAKQEAEYNEENPHLFID